MVSGHSQSPCAPPSSRLGYAALPRVWCALMCHGDVSQILAHWQSQKAPQAKGVLPCRHTVVCCPRLALQYYLNLVLSRDVAFANDYFARRRVPFSPLPFMVLCFSGNSYPFWSTPPPECGPNLLLSTIFA